MLTHNLVLKSNELYLVGDIATDGSGELATGLYARDTRHLNRLKLTLNGRVLRRLQVILDDLQHARVLTANPELETPARGPISPMQVLVEQVFALDDRLTVDVVIRNYGSDQVDLQVGVEAGADFRDLFDIRGYRRDARGTTAEPVVEQRTITFGYTGLDGVPASTELTFDREPNAITRLAIPSSVSSETQAAVQAGFDVRVGGGAEWRLRVTVRVIPAGGPSVSSGSRSLSRARIVTDHGGTNRSLRRSLVDLDALQTPFPDGEVPAAGIPWFVAPFGRDSLITGLQTLHLMPERAIGTLRVLAALQGERVDPHREEEPGKILHEMRYGEMARLGEVPHSPYFGTVDATPLFVWLFAETVAWTADRTLYADLLRHVKRALEWMKTFGDRDGDGFIEYPTDQRGLGQITHQVWKDSHDSAHHVDGSTPPGPIAAVEVQGYAFAALSGLAEVARWAGDLDWAGELSDSALELRRRVEEAFWIEERNFYAQGLDGEKRPIAQFTSNPGHLLLCGLPSSERAQRVAQRLREPHLWTGWGVRTLSASERTYNPMSYHNGSVWPHDNSLIGAGCYRYGAVETGQDILRGLLDAARSDRLHRLPELFCGFERTRRPDELPVPYPVSCSPQAWAAGSLLLLTRSMLGLEPDVERGVLKVQPRLPQWINRVVIEEMHVLGRRGSLRVERDGSGYLVSAPGLPLEVVGQV